MLGIATFCLLQSQHQLTTTPLGRSKGRVGPGGLGSGRVLGRVSGRDFSRGSGLGWFLEILVGSGSTQGQPETRG